MKKMSIEEARQFLSAPVRTGKLATVREDGTPHVAPIWFALDGDSLVFNTGKETVKGKNLERTRHAALCVDDEKPPFSFVTIEGAVTLSEDMGELKKWATIIGGRYMGQDKAEQVGARNAVPGEFLVHLRMEKVVGVANLAE